MKLFLIRHGQTQGNQERRYIGRTDQPLSQAGLDAFCNMAYPFVQTVYCSPMCRCRQTAQILYPTHTPVICADLRECDFGALEGKTHRELADDPDYRAWVAAAGAMTPPGGEAIATFKERCCAAVAAMIEEQFATGAQRVAVVTHGGVIMAVLERFAAPRQPFYMWQPDNLAGFALQISPERWREKQAVTVSHRLEAGGMLACFTPFQ